MKSMKTKMLVTLSLSLSLGILAAGFPTSTVSAKAYENDKVTEAKVIKEGDEITNVKPMFNDSISEVKKVKNNEYVTGFVNTKEGNEKVTYVKDQVLFRAQDGVSFNEVKDVVKEDNGNIVGYIESLNQYQVEYPDSTLEELQSQMDKLKTEEKLAADSVVLNIKLNVKEDAEPSGFKFTYPNDPWTADDISEDNKPEPGEFCAENFNWDEEHPAGYEWGAEQVKAPSAWQFKKSMDKVKVGVLEVGDFSFNNDVYFMRKPYNNDYDYKEFTNTYHADHVAGILAANHDNNKGTAGIACNAILYGYGSAPEDSAELLKELEQAIVKDGVKVINYSAGYVPDQVQGGGMGYTIYQVNKVLGAGLKKFIQDGHDFVIAASAGNNRSSYSNSLTSAQYNSPLTIIGAPGYEENSDVKDRIIVVGSEKIGENGCEVLPTCQLGKRVDVLAPGYKIFSTLKGDTYGFKTGTSMAAPHAAGVASMIWGLAPSLNGKQVKEYIVEGAEDMVTCEEPRLSDFDAKSEYPNLNAAGSIKRLSATGKVKKLGGWCKLEGKYYFLSNGGFLKSQTTTIAGEEYTFDENGAVVND